MPDMVRPQPSPLYRWSVLAFISLAQGGNYYIYDSINPLERIFIDHLGFSATQFGWLNASYSVAAVATLLIGGIIIDRIGTKKAITMFAFLCLMGAVLTALRGSAPVMIAGRTVLGLGAESMIVAVTTALAKWFKGKELSFAFGINLTIARLASVAADNSPTWANRIFYPQGPAGPASWQGPCCLAVGAGIMCVATALIYWALETRAESLYELGKAGAIDKLEFKGISASIPHTGLWSAFALRSILRFFRFAPSPSIFHEQDTGVPWRRGGLEVVRVPFPGAGRPPEQPASLVRYDRDASIRLLVDRVGKRAWFMMFGSLLLMPVYLMMAYSNICLYVPVALMGIAFSLIPAVMWPSVAYIVDESRLGTAYALMTLIQQSDSSS